MSTQLDAAKQHWQQASEAHVVALAAVRTAQEALDRLQGLIAEEAAKLTAAQAEQRAGILAAFGLGGKAEEPQQSVADIRAHLDAFESVLPEHQQALQQAQEYAKQTDAAVSGAELQILSAKAVQAIGQRASMATASTLTVSSPPCQRCRKSSSTKQRKANDDFHDQQHPRRARHAPCAPHGR